MRVQYEENYDVAIFNGERFRRDKSTGYYLSSRPLINGRRVRLHIYVWTYFNGEIPKGYHIHHKDENKYHNDIDNLEMLSMHNHLSIHAQEQVTDHLDVLKARMSKACAAAPAWHASEAGHEWHKQHYEKMKSSFYKKITCTCIVCGKEYETIYRGEGNSKFCSNNCKSTYRRRMHLDDEERICPICGKTYTVNKYSVSKTCGPKCGSQLGNRTKREKNRAS